MLPMHVYTTSHQQHQTCTSSKPPEEMHFCQYRMPTRHHIPGSNTGGNFEAKLIHVQRATLGEWVTPCPQLLIR